MNEWMNERTDHKYGDILCPVIDLYCVIAVVSIVVSIARVVGVVFNVGAARGPSPYRAPMRDVGLLPVRQRHGPVELLSRDAGRQVVKLVDVRIRPEPSKGRLRLQVVPKALSLRNLAVIVS